MSTPKRRKTHDLGGSPVRGIEYFFSKTIDHQASAGGGLTDEEFARQLQEQWNREETVPRSASDRAAEELATGQRATRELDTIDLMVPKNGDAETPANPVLSLQTGSADTDEYELSIPFDQSPLLFDTSDYLPSMKEQWMHCGGSASYAFLVQCFVLVNATQSRIKIVDTLVNMLRTLIEGDASSLLPAVWLATNSISPPFIDLELGLGGSAISKALKKVCGLDNSGLKNLYNKYGDAGDVAYEAKRRQSLTLRKPKALTIKGVFESLIKIAQSRGAGCQESKQRIVERLVQDTRSAEESRYIVRTLVQHLRIGAVRTTMLIALSRAFVLARPPGSKFMTRDRNELAKLKKEDLADLYSRAEEIVKASFARHPNYNDLVPIMLETGVSEELIVRCGPALHIPLRPMLGSITRDLNNMLLKLQGRDFACEFKYDGQRAQVHCDEHGKVTIFSRHLETMTDKYPDLVALMPKIRGEGVSSFILEGEIVAINHATGEIRPFQTLTNRARKDVLINEVKVDVCLFSFDLMYLNGEELLNRTFRERRELLRSMFTEIKNQFTWVKSLDATSEDLDSVQEFFEHALDSKCEGIMVKVLDNAETSAGPMRGDISGHSQAIDTRRLHSNRSNDKVTSKARGTTSTGNTIELTRRKALLATYEPDKRVESWLKVKKDYSSTTETIDLIPIGGWHGQGRKSKWWSPILLAIRNPRTGQLEAVTKCISGFTDKFYQENKEKYAEGGPNVISRPSYVDYAGEPDVWFNPSEVFELQFADITLSPTYTAAIGLVSDERGLSTRFPRFLKVREDKSIDEATTADYLANLYRIQESRASKPNSEPPHVDECT